MCITLSMILSTILALLLFVTAEAEPCTELAPSKKVTVIGGGLAGVFAASVLELKEIPYNILEADNRWGGRLRSFTSPFPRDPSQDYDPQYNPYITLEEGAAFMYGTEDPSSTRENPILRLFRNLNVDTHLYDPNDWDTYDANGIPIDDTVVSSFQDDMAKSVEMCLDKSGEEWFRDFRRGRKTADKSAKTLLKNCKGQFAWEVDDPTDLEAAMTCFYVETENALNLDEFGRASFPEDSYFTFSGDSFTQFDEEGTTPMMQRLVDVNLDPASLFLNHRVTKVIYDEGTSMYTTTASDLQDNCYEVESEYVIVAAPVNVLPNIEFYPPLGISEHPIEQVVVEKFWVQFSQRFWDNDRTWIFTTNSMDGGTPTWFFNYNKVAPGSNVLLAFLRESQLDLMEQSSDPVGDVVLRDLKKLDNWNQDIEYQSFVSHWREDNNFLGSWEVWKLDGTYFDFQDGLKPTGKLHKAGAGFCMNYYGFTWGAIFSGIWTAEWIAQRIEKPLVSGDLKDAPYTPCQDKTSINNLELRTFYEKYGSLFDPFV